MKTQWIETRQVVCETYLDAHGNVIRNSSGEPVKVQVLRAEVLTLEKST